MGGGLYHLPFNSPPRASGTVSSVCLLNVGEPVAEARSPQRHAGHDVILPLVVAEPEERPGREAAEKGAQASGPPFISFFTPSEMVALAREAE
jgi:hypothetical protein